MKETSYFCIKHQKAKYMADNPFILEPYKSKELFCDRESETHDMLRYIENGRNITLISPRRLGKTGLIYRVFDEIHDRKASFETFYMDISSTQSVDDFIKILSESVVTVLNQQTRISDFFRKLGGIRPVLSYDSITGKPEITLSYRDEQERDMTLKTILSYLESNSKKVVLAIDEFQQIREYNDVNMEALLRTYIQPLHNVRFIFCGSKKHTMIDMFSNARKPFYESTTFLPLGKLDEDVYADFITGLFAGAGKTIDREIVLKIIDWTRDHTFYTQTLCNEIFSRCGLTVTIQDFTESIRKILYSNRDRFLEIQRLLTPAQWKLLKAISKEGYVLHPTSSVFISKHKLTSGPAVLKNLNALIDKELILTETEPSGTRYSIYNVFLSRYLETQ